MGVKMVGRYYTRKPDLEFPDVQTMNKAWNLVGQFAPYTIRSTYRNEYLAIYGQDEAANLDAGNLVQSYSQRFVVGGVLVENIVKPEPKVPGSQERAPLCAKTLVGTMTAEELDNALDEFGERLINKLIAASTK